MLQRLLCAKCATIWLIFCSLGICWTEQNVNALFTRTKSQEMKKFGCLYENKDYFVTTNSIFNPVYGSEVAPMDFSSVAKFDEVLNEIHEEYTIVIKEFPFTNIPEFMDYYDSYKKKMTFGRSNFKNFFKTFFKNYVPKYIPSTLCTSLSIEILNRLIRRFPEMSESVHMIAATTETKDGLLQKLNIERVVISPFAHHKEHPDLSEEGYYSAMDDDFDERNETIWVPKLKGRPEYSSQEPPKYLFDFSHSAALIRIRIEGRLGYVLLDNGYGLRSPVVLMEDGAYPHRPFTRDARVSKVMEFYLPRRDYILAKHADTATNNTNAVTTYYIEKPYCSFTMTTTKLYIATMNRLIVRRDETGTVMAFIKMNLIHKPEFSMGRRPNRNSRTIHKMIPFGSRENLNGTLKQHYDQVLSVLNFSGLEEMLTLAEDIYRDETFKKRSWKLVHQIAHIYHNNISRNVPF